MSAIVNDRDVLLQAASVRFVLPTIDPIRIPGLPGAFGDIDQLKDDVEDLGEQINHLMNTSGAFYIRAPELAFFGAAGTTTPSTITLTAERGSGLVGGTIAWSVFAGSATISPSTGNSTTVSGSTVTGRSVTIRARLTIDMAVYDAYATITRFGAVSAVDQIDLTNQVTGQLANSKVSGLGALALLNTVNLNTQTTGALNGLTQVTNLGNLAYANSIAANQIGAGQLAAGVVYAGTVNATQVNSGSFVGKSFTGGTFTGALFRTAATGERLEIDSGGTVIRFITATGRTNEIRPFGTTGDNGLQIAADGQGGGVRMLNYGTGPAVICQGGANGPGLQVQKASGPAGDAALVVSGGANNAPLRISPGPIPTNRTEGYLSVVNGELIFADGTHWYRFEKVQIT